MGISGECSPRDEKKKKKKKKKEKKKEKEEKKKKKKRSLESSEDNNEKKEKKSKKEKKKKKLKKDKKEKEAISNVKEAKVSALEEPRADTCKEEASTGGNVVHVKHLPDTKDSQDSKKKKRKQKKKKKRPDKGKKFNTSMVKINRMKTVNVNGMPHGTKVNNVRKFFRPCGGIQYINMQKFDDTGKTRGMCTITFKSLAAAQKAIGLTGKWWGKRYVEIKQYAGLGESYTPPNITDMPSGCTTIYVGNLDFKVDEKDLSGAFAGCGEIQEIRLATDADGNKRGFAHITFAKTEGVEQAILNLATGDYLLRNRPIRIDYDIPHVDENGYGAV